MNTSRLQSFASNARNQLMNAVKAQLEIALAPNSAVRVDSPATFEQLEAEIRSSGGGDAGKSHVVERYAYRWFNRIIAFRYMDVHGFTATPVVSTVNLIDPNGLPEILAAAKRGEYDETVFGAAGTGNAKLHDHIEALFNGVSQAEAPQGRAYGLLLQAQCRYWNKFMPFMFENTNSINGKVDELLMPADLLAEGSALRNATLAMTPEDCGAGCGSDSDNKGNVEIIGWLYQFYIAERKHEVMAGFDRGKKAGKDEIPAATQLFTPDWIVQYLVQNTVGRLWMQNHPDCRLSEDWDYYIPPSIDRANDGDKDLFLSVDSPEELTVCDPACGSGHMLTYAFDLLYSIYEDEGYSPSEIPGLILQQNLFGMEIDERAANLAAFALTMKARSRSRRFFRHQVMPHIQCITPEYFTDEEVTELNKLYDVTLDASTWNTYQHADIYGSLIQPDAELAAVSESITNIESSSLFDESLVERGNQVLTQTAYLARQYAAVVANPPYMGSGNMGDLLKKFVNHNYKDGKADLFAAFILRCFRFVPSHGRLGFMSPYVWMFISSYERLRKQIISHEFISSLIQLEYSGFDGATVPICTFVLGKGTFGEISQFVRLSDFVGAGQQAPKSREIIAAHRSTVDKNDQVDTSMAKYFFECDQQDFDQIPGSPIVYWLSDSMRKTFSIGKPLEEVSKPRQGLATADNNRFIREWWEVSQSRSSFNCTSHEEAATNGKHWFPYNKGGEFRKWYGNQDYVINWEHDGRDIYDFRPRSVVRNPKFYFRESVSWSKISSSDPAFRYFPSGFIFDVAGTSIFSSNELRPEILGFSNSSTAHAQLTAIAPTLNFEVGQIAALPISNGLKCLDQTIIHSLISISKSDWDSYETSWNFGKSAVLNTSQLESHQERPNGGQARTLSDIVSTYFENWKATTVEQRRREARNNEIVADAYGVRDEMSCDVPIERVSLKRNPAFVYPDNTPEERDELFARDIIKEIISYAVGCMFGRYSLDKPGLILASQGETLEDYYAQIPNPSFEPDRDNVIPVTGVDCFEDDIVSRFRKFLEVALGKENLAENIAYIQSVLGKDLRKYFVNDFYNDHVKMYKNRPIYWQYSSRTDNKGSFKALVYLHRYTSKTNGTVLGYLRDYTSRIAGIAEQREKSDRTQDKRASEKLHKAIAECKAYEDQTLYPLATRNLEIDLDDGVLVNYLRLGKALREIPAIEKKRKDVESWTWPHFPLTR